VGVEQYEPAILIVLESQEPDIVLAMMEAGASLSVKNRDRQTPLEFTKRMVQTHSLSCQLLAGNPRALNTVMSNL
jgi:ankyrin repeat protein